MAAAADKNWPDVFFKWILGIVASGIFIIGTKIFDKLDKVEESQSGMNARIEKAIDAIGYIREDVSDLKEENKELRKEVDNLKEQMHRLQ